MYVGRWHVGTYQGMWRCDKQFWLIKCVALQKNFKRCLPLSNFFSLAALEVFDTWKQKNIFSFLSFWLSFKNWYFCAHHCSVDPSAPNILRPRAQIQSTTSKLGFFPSELQCEGDENKQKEAGVGKVKLFYICAGFK